MATVVLSVLGDDRPGLVDAVAQVVADHGGSWDRSHMSRLAGKFAGIVVVTIADDDAQALIDGLGPIRADGLLEVTASIATDPDADSDPTPGAVEPIELQLVGADRPGIVREIASVLAANDVSIIELVTATTSAPMAGEPLFEASLSLNVPPSLDLDRLRAALEDLANELMVDIDLDTAR
ncbi:glycine cleavage system protein R [Ilumatobacter coccineus]|uniref:ACT domain-containing protein n=1 Tax=Ilumatobacter coccineus (strain NBRC 103263 / KCTC 29153 / YM16-304) TaxID=1313172 RepID=A0A6C7EF14_ILUCY|nr:ACT domain-containing protein [Ilumatobacter coccineus]BAN03208.1 hypothetical protein YM304_28940 [Ilumatobacter coccineus YM16-304]